PTTRKPASASGSECRPFPHPASRISAPGRHETRRSTSRASLADVARAFSTATVVRYRGSSKKRAAEIIFRSGGPYPGYALSHGAARGLAPSQLAQLLRRDEIRELRAARPEFLPRPFEIERRERSGWELALECVEPLSAGGQADRKLLERGVMADQQDGRDLIRNRPQAREQALLGRLVELALDLDGGRLAESRADPLERFARPLRRGAEHECRRKRLA